MKRLCFGGMVFSAVVLFIFALTDATLSGPDDAYKLKYKLKKGQTLEYVVSSQSEQSMEIMGGEQTSQVKSESKVQIVSEGMNKAGNLVYTMQYTSFKVGVSSAMLDTTLTDPKNLLGKKIQKEVNLYGDQIKSVMIDTIKSDPLFAQTFNAESEFMPNIPDKELKIGTPITVTDVDTVSAMGGKRVVKSEMEYTLMGKENRSGYNCLKMAFKGTITVEGKGSFQGMMKFFLEGDGDTAGTMYFAPEEGIIVAVESESNMEMTAAITGQQNMTIPISSTIKASMNLVK